MIEVTAKQFLSVISKEHPHADDIVAHLVRLILVLSERVNNPMSQSFYFRMAIDAHRCHLAQITTQYEQLKAVITNTSFDDLNEQLSWYEGKFQWYLQTPPSGSRLLRQIAESAVERKCVLLNQMILAKSKYNSLKSVGDYTSDELLQFFT